MTTKAITLRGLEAVTVNVTVSRGPALRILGLPETSERETRVRVRAALSAAGYLCEAAMGTVVLSPAMSSGACDLAVAVALLLADGSLAGLDLDRIAFCAELSLGGELRAPRGLYAMTRAIDGVDCVIVPAGAEFEVHDRVRAIGCRDLREVMSALARIAVNPGLASPVQPLPPSAATDDSPQRRVLVTGEPGCGKTKFARELASGEVANLDLKRAIYSVALGSDTRDPQKPFRAPHHTVSEAGLLGGVVPARPGEVTIAHGGVLFLDEVDEFRASAIESLGRVLRDGEVKLQRAGTAVTFPARPAVLVASATPCPCGFHGSKSRNCACSPERIRAHQRRVDKACEALGITERVTL